MIWKKICHFRWRLCSIFKRVKTEKEVVIQVTDYTNGQLGLFVQIHVFSFRIYSCDLNSTSVEHPINHTAERQISTTASEPNSSKTESMEEGAPVTQVTKSQVQLNSVGLLTGTPRQQ